MICPPSRPASGPISIIQSAARMISSSCSTTMTVLPKSRNCCSTLMSLSVSLLCSPILGSSRMYRLPTRLLPSDVARLMRWLSPPDSDAEGRLSVRYSSPTSVRNCSLCLISVMIRCATPSSSGVSVSCSIHCFSAPMGISTSSVMLRPPTFT